MLKTCHSWRACICLGNEAIFPSLRSISPQPSIHSLIVEIRIDPVTSSNRQVIRSLCLCKHKRKENILKVKLWGYYKCLPLCQFITHHISQLKHVHNNNEEFNRHTHTHIKWLHLRQDKCVNKGNVENPTTWLFFVPTIHSQLKKQETWMHTVTHIRYQNTMKEQLPLQCNVSQNITTAFTKQIVFCHLYLLFSPLSLVIFSLLPFLITLQ